MKRIFYSLLLFLTATVAANAQEAFKNYGNFHAMAGSSIGFFGDVTLEGTFTDDSDEIIFGGTGNQMISAPAAITFKNFTANNAVGLTLQQHVIVTFLTLTDGPLNLNGRTIRINNNAATAISRTNGYIVSENVSNANKVIWNIGTDATAHVFPFGTAGGDYIPITLTNTSGNIGNVTASTYPTSADNLPFPSSPDAVTNVDGPSGDNSADVVDRFWQIDKDGVGGNATITFVATAAEVGSITDLKAQRWNSATQAWDAPLAGQTNTATSVTVPGVTSFSPWALSGNNVILPVELVSFTATPMQNKVSLDWKTASEHNNDYFTLLRSEDGEVFEAIGKIPAGKMSNTLQKYNYLDIDPLPGRSYYRLKQTDFDGQYKLSDIRMVQLDEVDIRIFPNPIVNNEFSLDFQRSLESQTMVTVYNVTGAIMYQTMIEPGVNVFKVRLNYPPKGVYLVKMVSQQFNLQQAIVVH